MPAHVSRGTGVHHGRCHRTLERLRLSPSAPDAGAPTAACGLDPFAGTSSGRFRCGRCGCSSSCGCSSCSLDSRGALSSAPPIIAPAPTPLATSLSTRPVCSTVAPRPHRRVVCSYILRSAPSVPSTSASTTTPTMSSPSPPPLPPVGIDTAAGAHSLLC